MVQPPPHPPHTEDWVVDPHTKKIVKVLDDPAKIHFLDTLLDADVESIFGAEIQRADGQGIFIPSGAGTRSLGTIRVEAIFGFLHRCCQGHWDYRVSFADESGAECRLKIVDLTREIERAEAELARWEGIEDDELPF